MTKLRKFLCDVMDWHTCTIESSDGVNNESHCKYCGKRCLQDSQRKLV